jgi:hypothetical protein
MMDDRMTGMKKAWKLLNSPIIVAFLSIAVVSGMLRLGFMDLFSVFDQDDERRKEADALGRLELVSFSEVQAAPGESQKFVGEFKNHSPFIVQDIQGTICFYNGNGKLIDVLSGPLTGVGKVPPNGSGTFSLSRDFEPIDDSGPSSQPVRGDGVRTTFTFVDLVVIEAAASSIAEPSDPFN